MVTSRAHRTRRALAVLSHGGRVISRPGAGLLEVEQSGGAASVTVVVRPTAHGHTTDPGPVPARCA